jgi:hypothetical protein
MLKGFDMVNFQTYLDDFKKEIENEYKQRGMATAIAEYFHEDLKKTPIILPKLDGPPMASTVAPGGRITPIKASYRNVKPKNAGFILALKDWADEPDRYYMHMLVRQLGAHLAEREYAIIVEGMVSCAGNNIRAKKKGELSKQDIKEAQNWVASQGAYADSVIMHLTQKMKFWRNKELLDPGRIPQSCVPQEKRGPYYAGWLDAVNVYWNRFAKDFAVVFSRREIITASTTLEVRFDNMTRPKQLILKKLCVAAPMFDQAVAKILLQ